MSPGLNTGRHRTRIKVPEVQYIVKHTSLNPSRVTWEAISFVSLSLRLAFAIRFRFGLPLVGAGHFRH